MKSLEIKTCKVAGYMQKQIIFLFTGNEHMDIEIKNAMPFKFTQKNGTLSYKSNKTYTGIVAEKSKYRWKKSGEL